MNRTMLLAASSMLSVTCALAAYGQENSGNVEQVIVSASRINVAGYEAPTPVTVVGAAQLQRDAKPDLGDAIRELPAVGTSIGPNNSGNANTVAGTAGLDLINLRQLGITRTLVLFDGQRIVPANVSGGVDLATMPSSLVQRVDIVTGGASAAWGSDAVAGVVNIILNKNFTGFSANLQGSSSYKGDMTSEKAEVSFGTDFDGTRGHIIVSGSYTMSPDALFVGRRNYAWNTHLFPNPAYNGGSNGQPHYIHVSNVGQSQATKGGLIMGCGANATTSVNCALRGIQFTGANATPSRFDFGAVNGAFSTGSTAESAWFTGGNFVGELTSPYHQLTLFEHTRYNLSDNISASLELNYGKTFSQSTSTLFQKLGNLAIARDNAFLPQSIRDQMAALNYNYIFLGTNNLNGAQTTKSNVVDDSLMATNRILGASLAFQKRQLFRGVFSLDGTIGDDWTWSGYAQHSMSRTRSEVPHNQNVAAYNRAVDAVAVTSANVGTSGLPIGSIACRSTLTDPGNGCAPLNVFGEHDVPGQTLDYITNTSRWGGDFGMSVMNQDVFAGSMQGQLPEGWSLPAGRIAVAFGAEYRKEGFRQTNDPTSRVTGWSIGNFAAYSGHFDVEEGFAEITVPVLKDNLVQSLEFNTAGRITSYSSSGMVETWKLGLTSQINDDVRVRSTWSFDIRAPVISELYSNGFATQSNFTNPYNGQNEVGYTLVGGNPDLKPEQATTVSGGVVLTPHWVDGLSISLDWYSINISKAITTISTLTTTNLCAAGDQFYCSQISFANGFMYVKQTPINANQQSVSGLDFQSDYNFPLLNGRVDVHLVGNYTDQQSQLAQGRFFDYAGSIGADSLVTGLPKLHATLATTYDAGDWQATVQGRFIGSAKLNNAWGPLDVDNNSVPGVAYLDLRASYNFNKEIQLYGAIDNVTNVPPPVYPSLTGNLATGGNTIYDAIGRMFRAGIRVRY